MVDTHKNSQDVNSMETADHPTTSQNEHYAVYDIYICEYMSIHLLKKLFRVLLVIQHFSSHAHFVENGRKRGSSPKHKKKGEKSIKE